MFDLLTLISLLNWSALDKEFGGDRYLKGRALVHRAMNRGTFDFTKKEETALVTFYMDIMDQLNNYKLIKSSTIFERL